MNVRCPECKTLFRLADDKVGAHGAKVRCGKCRHVFVATRGEGATATTAPPPTSFSAPSFAAPPPSSTIVLNTAGLASAGLPPTPSPYSASPGTFPPVVDALPRAEGLPDLPDWALPPPVPRPKEPSELSFSYEPPRRDPLAGLPGLDDDLPPADEPPPALPPADEEPIDAATAMGRRRTPELAPVRRRAEADRPESESALQEPPRFGGPPADFAAPEEAGAAAPSYEPPMPGFEPGQHQDSLTFDDHTTVEARPNWLGTHTDGLEAARTGGARWDPPTPSFEDYARSDPAHLSPAPMPPPLAAPPPPEPEGPSTLDPEALFGGEEVPAPPVSFGPPVLASPPPSPAAARIAERRDAQPRREVDPARIRRATERPFASPVHGRRAILRAGMMVVALAAVLAVFVLWRNDWRLEPMSMMMARAFGGAGAPRVRSQIPGLAVRKVRRDVFESASGHTMLAVSGEIENDGADRLSAVSVLVRLLDREGNPVAEREQFAVGPFEPEVIHGFADAAIVDAEYKKRRTRSIVSPNSRLEFQILFFPLPAEVEGLRLRVLVEVTGAVPSRS